jgi:hypothetical protein
MLEQLSTAGLDARRRRTVTVVKSGNPNPFLKVGTPGKG